MKKLLLFYIVSLGSSLSHSQDNNYITNSNQLQFHLNWSFQNYNNLFPNSVNSDIARENLFSYSVSWNETYDALNQFGKTYYTFYNIGIAFQKELNFYHYRLRVDYFNYEYYGENIISYLSNSNTSLDSSLTINEISNLQNLQIKAGLGLKKEWKSFKLSFGGQVPFHIQGNTKGFKIKTRYNNSTSSTVNSSEITYTYVPGGFFIGLSPYVSLEFLFFKNYSIGIEGSGGIVYYRSRTGPDINGINFLFHNPSAFISYKF